MKDGVDRLIFFFNDTATTEIYTLSLHDALPICRSTSCLRWDRGRGALLHLTQGCVGPHEAPGILVFFRILRLLDRKSTRLNSSHANISYAVFCLKKKNPTLLYARPVIAQHITLL